MTLSALQTTLNKTFFDTQNQTIRNFAEAHFDAKKSDLENARSLYYAVRDEIRYDPFHMHFDFDKYGFEEVLERGSGHCIDKSGLLVTCLRVCNIPAKIGLARVRNHMGTERLEKILKTDVLVPHGYTEVFLEDKWIKCTPAFNAQLCLKLNVEPLDWDGKSDSVFQKYDRKGAEFMQYEEDYGAFEEFPLMKIAKLMVSEYPHMFDGQGVFLKEKLKAF